MKISIIKSDPIDFLDYKYTGPQPHAVTDAGDKLYSYDKNGNMVGWQSKTTNASRTIIWNEENRVKSIADSGSATEFLYDDSGERAVKGGGGNETVYLNRFYSLKNGDLGSKHIFAGETRVCTKIEKDGGSIQSGVPGAGAFLVSQGLQNALSRGNVQNKRGILRRLPGTGGTGTTIGTNPPIEKFEFFYHGDHLGSSSFITDDAGAVYQHLEYFPYGETWVEDGGSGQMPMYRFTGKELDPETGLYYYGARYYDPVLSRWISTDPIDRFNAQSPPLGLNLYQYGLNNPVRLIDPTGREESGSIFTKLADWYHAQTEKFGKWVGEKFAQARGAAQESQISQIEQATGEASTEVRQAEAGLMEKVTPEQEKGATEAAQTVIEAATAKGLGKALGAAGALVGQIESKGINITGKRLTHVLERHTVGGALSKGKSLFNAGEDVTGLIRAGEGVPTTVQIGGNFQRIVNAGREIGMDRTTGQPTSVYTVITDKAGNLVTSFPGLPTR